MVECETPEALRFFVLPFFKKQQKKRRNFVSTYKNIFHWGPPVASQCSQRPTVHLLISVTKQPHTNHRYRPVYLTNMAKNKIVTNCTLMYR